MFIFPTIEIYLIVSLCLFLAKKDSNRFCRGTGSCCGASVTHHGKLLHLQRQDPRRAWKMYVADERFKKNIDKYGEGTAEYASEAIEIYSGR